MAILDELTATVTIDTVEAEQKLQKLRAAIADLERAGTAATGAVAEFSEAMGRLRLASPDNARLTMRGRARDDDALDETRAGRPCSLGVGCDTAGVCYAAANGQPEQCGRK